MPESIYSALVVIVIAFGIYGKRKYDQIQAEHQAAMEAWGVGAIKLLRYANHKLKEIPTLPVYRRKLAFVEVDNQFEIIRSILEQTAVVHQIHRGRRRELLQLLAEYAVNQDAAQASIDIKEYNEN